MVVTGELTGVVSAHSQKHSHACLVFCCFTTRVTVASQSATYNATLLLVPVHGWSIQSVHKGDKLDPRATLMPVYMKHCDIDDISLHGQRCMFLLVKIASSDAYLQGI